MQNNQEDNQEDKKSSATKDSSSSINEELIKAQQLAKQARTKAQATNVEKVIQAKNDALASVPESLQLSVNVLNRIKRSKIKDNNFDTSQIIKLEDAPMFLILELKTEIGFTPEKVLRIARKLDPRIIIELEGGDILLDRKRLKVGFTAYLKEQQSKGLLKSSRGSRAALRRNIQLREVMGFLEEILSEDLAMQQKLTSRINNAFGDSYRRMQDGDILAFVESYRINAERKRLRQEEEEGELAALEALEMDF